MKTLYSIIAFTIILCPDFAYSQAGKLDPDFGGGDGFVSTLFYTDKPALGYAVAIQEDAKILVSGYTKAPDGKSYAIVTRYLPDGTLDNSFNGNGKIILQTNGEYSSSYGIAVQPDGKIVVITESKDTAEIKLQIYRFLNDGNPDNDFDEDGIVTTSLSATYLGVHAILIQPDGKILVGGYVGYGNDEFDRFFVVRYMPDGELDQSFDGDGIVKTFVGESYTNISSLLIQPDGKIIAAGYAVFNDNDEFALVRYDANGTQDHTFGENGIAHSTFTNGDDRGIGAVLQQDGKIVMGGYSYNSMINHSEFAAARFTTDGTLDHTFHGDGMASVTLSGEGDEARAITLQPDGKILLGGYAHSTRQGGQDMAIVRLNENGIPDFTFDGDGVAIYEDAIYSSEIYAMAVAPDGKIVATGYERTGGLNSIRVARIISGLTTSTNEIEIPLVNVSLYPNPVTDQVNINYQLDRNETISINLCDIQGRIVQNLLPLTERSVGPHIEEFVFNHPLSPGNYFVNMQSAGWIKSVKVVVE